MKITISDSRLNRHVLEMDDSASMSQMKALLAELLPVPAGFAPMLVYQKKILCDGDSVRSINYTPANSITLVFFKISPGVPPEPEPKFLRDRATATGRGGATTAASINFLATVEEIAKALLHDGFLIVQPTLTHAVRAIFVHQYKGDWLKQYKTYLGSSMQEFAVDDGRAFDLYSLAEVLKSSISDVIRPALGLDRAQLDPELQKLQLHVKYIYMTRNWFSHEFSVTVSECQHAITSLIELCALLERLLADADLAVDFEVCVSELQKRMSVVDRLQDDASTHALIPFNLRLDQVASILLLRSFERLCTAGEDKSSPLVDPSKTNYNNVTGCMRYDDVVDVIRDMKSTKMGKVSVADYELVLTGRNMFFHGTQRDISLALLFCIGAAGRLLRFLGRSAEAACGASVDELLAVCRHLQLFDEASVLRSIASSQGVSLPSDLSDIAWLRGLLWALPPTSSSIGAMKCPAAPRMPKDSCSAKFHDHMLRFGLDEIVSYCTGQMKDFKTCGSLVLPAADTASNKQKRCDKLLAAVALSSSSPVEFGCIDAQVSAGLSLVAGQRAAEQRDLFFTGRQDELKLVCYAVEAVLLNSRPASTPAHVAVLGLPGMGKSLLVSQALLAMQKAHSAEQRNVYFLKLRGRSAASVEEDLASHSRSLGSKIGVAADCVASEALTKLKDYLARLRFVAVIDDATGDGLQAVAQWIPRSSVLYSVLVTSQQAPEELRAFEAKHGSFVTKQLSKFDESTSVKLLQTVCKTCTALVAEVNHLASIAGRMDHLPLGVRLFGEYSRSRYQRDAKALKEAKKAVLTAAQADAAASGAPFDEAAANEKFRSDYLASTGFCDENGIARQIFSEWTSGAELADQEVLQSSDKYPRGLVGTVRLVLHELKRLDVDDAKSSRQLMSILALCPSVDTPWSLFVGHDSSRCVAGLELVTSREGLSRSAVLVQRSGLVQVQGGGFSMHQLIQRVVRREVAGGVDAALRLVDGRVRGEDLEAADAYREMLPAAYHVVKEVLVIDASRSEQCKISRLRISELLSWLGGGALEVEINSTILHEVNEHNNESHYEALRNLAIALGRMGRDAEALVLNEQALVVLRRVLPADHPDITNAMINTAASYSKLRRYAEAVDLMEQGLAIRRRMLPADHPGIATAMFNTASSYFALGRDAEALDLNEQALAFMRCVLPADDPGIAAAMLNTAASYSKFRRHAEALDLREQGLAFRRRVLPADHPYIADAMIDTAASYSELGRHAEALDLREQGLAFRRRVLPADHPDIATAMFNTATSYSELGRHAEALDLREQGLAFRRRVLPADDPGIATAMFNTASSYSELGRHAEALDLREQGLAIRFSVLPADHPDIATAMMNTASSYSELGRDAEALDLREQALALRFSVLPADHPYIADAMIDTATSYAALERYAEAIDLMEQALAFRRRVLPADHPAIAKSLFSICYIMKICGFTSQCGWFAHEALQIARSNFSDSHPYLLGISNFIRRLINAYGASAIQSPPSPSSEHLRIGRLVRLHSLSTHELNGCQALVFGAERNGQVPVRLVEASDAVRAGVGWGKGVERMIKVENLQAMGQSME